MQTHEFLKKDIHFTELHTHLYGSLSAELLYEIGKQNPNPRWHIYTDFYEKHFSKIQETRDFFKVYDTPEKFKECYYFKEKAAFLEFQAKFNLIIALVKFDVSEIKYVISQVLEEYSKDSVGYVEFRIMYSPIATENEYREKTIAACLGLEAGELQTGSTGRLIVSLHRENGYEEQYRWLQKLMMESEIVSKYLVGIDFCNIEEGNPPKKKKIFFNQILEDNQKDPRRALAILYHVGESFQDKSHLSACRWILEASEYGAHRLGHCIALGETYEKFENTTREESPDEYLDTLDYILKNYEEIKPFGELSSFEFFSREKELVQKRTGKIKIHYSEEFLQNLLTFRLYGLHSLVSKGTVVESCPTSNLRIGMIESVSQLPIVSFARTNLKLTICADDPGIFHTSIPKEYEICRAAGVGEDILEKIRVQSREFVSEKLSGRDLLAP